MLKPCVPGVLPQPGDVRRVAACNLAGWSKSREETASTRTTFPERDTTHTKPESDFGIDTIGRLMILTRHDTSLVERLLIQVSNLQRTVFPN